MARAQRERETGLTEALSVIEEMFAGFGLSAEFVSAGSPEFPVHRCTVRDRSGRVVTASLGKGAGAQSRVSAMFEAWQHLEHDRGQAALARDAGRVRVLPVEAVVAQPELRGEEMIHRLARDHPGVAVACLRAEPLGEPPGEPSRVSGLVAGPGRAGAASSPAGGSSPGRPAIWYPAFARSPSCRSHPVPGDDLCYESYLRYAYDSGTAAGTTETEAVLHGLLEVVERDALSHALLDWYLDADTPIRVVDPDGLPGDLRRLHAEARTRLGAPPLVIDMTSDLGIPAYCALPSRAGPYPGVIGSGASLDPEYAVERALSEVVQSSFNMSLGVDLTLARRLESLRRWPLLERCARLDPEPLGPRLVAGVWPGGEPGGEPSGVRPGGVRPGGEESRSGAAGEADRTAGDHLTERERMGERFERRRSVAGQVAEILGRLEAAGFAAYAFRWNPGRARCPVLTVIVPGLDAFAMVHSAVPVLPTGRAARRLAGKR
ncbi:YcaO-like family protein [Streptosporangium sp. NPDC048047]|uniref:YcaO-like family protein n=1 Tax=Streptosporangium sp. NPDC048047 TaxID=3155748 RepID=UPI00341755EF